MTDLSRLEAALAAATPLPWDYPKTGEDWRLAAAAVNALPGLIAEVRALRKDAERLRASVGAIHYRAVAEGLPLPLEPEPLAFTVFYPVRGELEPVGCIYGELDAAIDAERAARAKREG